MANKMNGNVMLVLKIVGICVVIGSLVVAITQSYAILSEDVNHIKSDMEAECAENLREHGDYETSIKDIDQVCDDLQIDITKIKSDVEYLREDTKQILQELRDLKNQ